jgi:hypothetical protein
MEILRACSESSQGSVLYVNGVPKKGGICCQNKI